MTRPLIHFNKLCLHR